MNLTGQYVPLVVQSQSRVLKYSSLPHMPHNGLCFLPYRYQIALQASVAITRIARYDYPTAWPDLFTKLQRAMVEAHAALEALGNGSDAQTAEARYRSTLILMRAADVCARTLKELETVRVLAGKIRMTEVSRIQSPSFVGTFCSAAQPSSPFPF